MRRPSLGSILLGLIPFVATCFSVALWDRMYPFVLGFPFNFFWLILWLLLTPVCLWGAYRLISRCHVCEAAVAAFASVIAGFTLEKSALRPSAIVGCVRIASRNVV